MSEIIEMTEKEIMENLLAVDAIETKKLLDKIRAKEAHLDNMRALGLPTNSLERFNVRVATPVCSYIDKLATYIADKEYLRIVEKLAIGKYYKFFDLLFRNIHALSSSILAEIKWPMLEAVFLTVHYKLNVPDFSNNVPINYASFNKNFIKLKEFEVFPDVKQRKEPFRSWLRWLKLYKKISLTIPYSTSECDIFDIYETLYEIREKPYISFYNKIMKCSICRSVVAFPVICDGLEDGHKFHITCNPHFNTRKDHLCLACEF